MTNWHAHCLVMGRSGLPTAAKRKDRTMANENQNIFSRQDTFFGSEVCHDLASFKERCDLIVANRMSPDLADVRDRVYTRDLFQTD